MPKQSVNPFFCFEILQGGFLFHRHLFNDDIEQQLIYAGAGGSNIYYLVRTPKVRFAHQECHIVDQTLHASLLVGNELSIPVTLPLKELFPFSQHPEIEQHRFTVCVTPNQTDTLILRISPIANLETHIALDVSTILKSIDVDIGVKPEILYIGQSVDLVKRWQNHKQVNRAISLIDDNCELRLYFLQFSFFGEFKDFGDDNFNNLLDVSCRDSEEYRDRVSIVEQTLIQFYRPELNSQHVSGSVDTAPFNRAATKIGLESIGLSIGMHGHAFHFWSPRQVLDAEVATITRIDGQPRFLAGLSVVDDFLNR